MRQISRIYVPTTGSEDWRQFLADPATQWRRGYSAMAAALSWEAAGGALPGEISMLLGGNAELLLALPEHKVSLPGGGRASQCDVFALVRASGETVALAVEAKVDEPFGPTVGAWLDGASAGRLGRMAFLCELLGLENPPPDRLRYQLLHRTAAAVVEAGRFKTDRAAMIVQSFSPERRWFEDFAAFCEALGQPVDPSGAARVTLPSGLPLLLGWASGSEAFL
ncbi:hypothetical protein PVT71_10230 [Salipiger sp. H15]|uniref:DUF6946 domain-containing protein n=1 Tax=Alloyangia sp. H15 TaxID=3029062 RepID=A0AAU8ADN7_9RHOB